MSNFFLKQNAIIVEKIELSRGPVAQHGRAAEVFAAEAFKLHAEKALIR